MPATDPELAELAERFEAFAKANDLLIQRVQELHENLDKMLAAIQKLESVETE